MTTFDVHLIFNDKAGYPTGWKAVVKGRSMFKNTLGGEGESSTMNMITGRKSTPLEAVQSLYTQIVETYELKRFKLEFDNVEQSELNKMESDQMVKIKEWLSSLT